MSLNAYVAKANDADVVTYHLFYSGANTSDLTKVYGSGVSSIARNSEGNYTITWSDAPGIFLSAVAGLSAATPSDLAGQTVVFDTFTAGGKTLDFVLYSSTFAADDLLANEYLSLVISFKRCGAVG